jgi:hypothetical protein
MSQMNVSVVLLDPGVNGTASLPNVILTTFAEYAVHARSFQSQVSFTGGRKLAIFLGVRPTDLMLCPDSIRLMRLKVVLTKGRRGDRSGLLRGGSDSLWWIESPSDLPVTVAIPLESVLEKFKLIMKNFVITQSSGPMYQCGKHSLFIGRVVVRVDMEIEVGVCGFTVDSMAQ